MKSTDQLPLEYEIAYEINLEKNKKIFWFLNIASLLALVPFVLLAILFQLEFQLEIYTMAILIPMMIGSIIIHELIHGLFFKLGTPHKVKYQFHGWAASASVPGVYFSKSHYLKVGLAPAVLLNTLLVGLILVLPTAWLFPLYVTLAVHFSGCVGDFYVATLLTKYDSSTLIEDTGVGMKLYTKKIEEQNAN